MQHRAKTDLNAPLGSAQRLVRTAYAGFALLAAVMASILAWNYPLGSGIAVPLLLALGVTMFLRPWLWMVLVPGLLPLIGWAPWTGWLTFEEFDLLVLTSASAGYAHLASGSFVDSYNLSRAQRVGGFGKILIVLLGTSMLWAMQRGFCDAGGFVAGWWQGYQEPMNSVRVAKSFFFAIFLWPLWRAQSRQRVKGNAHGIDTASLLTLGMTLGLAGVALTTIWERMAFTGILNFASDYRTTGMFWEMHVGGAALDGYLALTVPFALHQLLSARRTWHWAGASLALGLGMYASLTTFSRGVYLALPVGVAVMMIMHYLRQRRPTKSLHTSTVVNKEEGSYVRAGLAMVVLYTAMAAWIFPTSGYRGAIAVMGAMLALTVIARGVQHMRLTSWINAALLTLVLAVAIFGGYALEGKISYVGFALCFVGCVLTTALARKRTSWVAAFQLASFFGVLIGAGLIFLHWGGESALLRGLPVLGLLMLGLVFLQFRKKPLWPDTLRWQTLLSGWMVIALMIVGVFSGGAYIGDRFSTGWQDMGVRLLHWRQGISMLNDGTEFAFGKGMGRYPATYYMSGPQQDRVGDYRLVEDDTGKHLILSGGMRTLPVGDGALLRFSQRIALPKDRVVLSADVKVEHDVALSFEVCPKHLLYTDYGCLRGDITVKPLSSGWQHIELPMKGPELSRGDWYAPKFLVFSVAVLNSNGVAIIDKIHLRDASGTELLKNPDFSHGLAHWMMSSDRNHLPWHIKNMPLNVVFDQGWVGFVFFLALASLALWRVTWGGGRDHSLAPANAGAIVGFWMVGMFDSLLDVPRVAFLFYFLLFIAVAPPIAALPGLSRK